VHQYSIPEETEKCYMIFLLVIEKEMAYNKPVKVWK
jgi:hypothetical protein